MSSISIASRREQIKYTASATGKQIDEAFKEKPKDITVEIKTINALNIQHWVDNIIWWYQELITKKFNYPDTSVQFHFDQAVKSKYETIIKSFDKITIEPFHTKEIKLDNIFIKETETEKKKTETEKKRKAESCTQRRSR